MRKVFFFAAGGSDAEQQLDSYALAGIELALVRPFWSVYEVATELGLDRLRVWGSEDRSLYRARWSQLTAGDLGLGYVGGRFKVAARVVATVYSPELGRQLFGTERERGLLTLFDESQPVSVSRARVLEVLGYSEAFVPRALFLPGYERQRFIRRAYSGPEDFLERGLLGQRPPRRFPRSPPTSKEPAPDTGGYGERLESRSRWHMHIPPAEPHRTEPVPPSERGPYALLESRDSVRVGDMLSLSVGLSARPGTAFGGLWDQPAAGPIERRLDVLVSAESFELVEGEWRNNLVVSPEDPYPTQRLLLRAHNPPQPGVRLIHALYALGGKTIGLASRFVRVLGKDEPDGPTGPPQFTNTALPLGDTSPPPDLEIRILPSGAGDGRLSWSLATPHSSVTVPTEPLFTDIGQRPEAFAKEIMSGIPERDGEPDLMAYLRGVGRTVRDHIPLPIWDALKDVSNVVRPARRPTVLLLSGEPYVPWELALVSDPVFPDAPPFLATQASVGRWMLLPHNRHFPPPASARPQPFVALWAKYAGSAYELPGAREEVRELARRFGAKEVQATLENALNTLTEGPGAHMLHFAGHGGAGHSGALEGLLIDDDRNLAPLSIIGLDLHSPPLVFLNACEVGAGNESLGTYSGTAAAFVAAGATAVVAPLWSIDDGEAPKIAVEFYERVLSGEPPAAVIADLRASFSSKDAVDRLGYQFFGHPLLVLDG